MGTLREALGIACDSATVMELRLFRQLCLVATVLTLFVIVPSDFLIRLAPGGILTDLGFGLASFHLYREACRGRYHTAGLFTLYLLTLTLCWFWKSGSHGGIGLFFFNAFIYALIFFRDRTRWQLFGAALADWLGLIALESRFPQWITHFQNGSARVIDLILSLTVTALSCSLMLWAVLSSYDREQRRLKNLNADLERNMAERLEAEQSLRQNRELLNAVIEGTSDAVYAKDTEGRYMLFNSAAARITGKSAGQALGKDDSFLFPAEESYLIMERDREIISTGEKRTHEFELTGGSGEKVVVQATKGPLRDANGSIAGVVGISRDITASRQVEDEIRKLNSELDQRVAERTARLQAAIQEQESFSYSVSHDLRAPLRHINSYSAILEEECADCLTPEARGYLERIRISSRSMGKLIDDLLELSRVGRTTLEKTAVDLSELAQAIAFRLRESAPRRRVEFRIAPGLTAQGDRILLQQALENLLDNAWKYSEGRESACIEVGRVEMEGQEVYFVRDNGVGFDMAYQDKLFGAFQRLHGAEFEGTGIGLATVKLIVKRHGGRVWAEGAVDAGATVYFTLGRRGERQGLGTRG